MEIIVTNAKQVKIDPPVPMEELGLDIDNTISNHPCHYVVVDKTLFFMAVLKYGIAFDEVNQTGTYKPKDYWKTD
jgi:hypothetical protein